MGEPAKTIRWIKKDKWYSESDCGLFTICKSMIKKGTVPIFQAFYKYKQEGICKSWGTLITDYDVKKCIAACEEQKLKGRKRVENS